MVDSTSKIKNELIELREAQAESVDSISKRLSRVERSVEKQESRNRNVIIGVVLAFLFIVGAIAVQVFLSNKDNSAFYSELEQNVYNNSLKVQDLNNTIDNLKIRNPYLK